MTIYKNGNLIKEMYLNGVSIKEVYAYGTKVFSKGGDGWRQASETTTLSITANNDSSISGTITLIRFDYYSSGVITDRYYQVSSTNLSSDKHGVVELPIGANTAVVYGTVGMSWEYYTPSTGTIIIAADELRRLFRLKSVSGVLELGSTLNVRSYYVEPVWDMAPAMSSTTQLTCSAGWSICHNRTSRISVSPALTVNVSTLNAPAGTGTFPLFAVASSATEATSVSLTCANTAHQVYDTQCIRTIGFVTLLNSEITGVTPITDTSYTPVNAISKTISGATLSVGAGYAIDTDGIRVSVPSVTYNFDDMIAAAADSTTPWAPIPDGSATGETAAWVTTTYATATPNLSGPCKIKVTASGVFPGTTYSGGGDYTLAGSYKLASGSDYTQVCSESESGLNSHKDVSVTSSEVSIPSGETVTGIRSSFLTSNISSGRTWNTSVSSTYSQEIEGTTQTRLVYAYVSRSSTSNSVSASVVDTSGDSAPFVSYVYLGTITVTRNSSTGTIS